MNLIEFIKASMICATRSKPTTEPPAAGPGWCINGYSEEDSWEALALARYRSRTGKFVRRRFDSEPDLVNRRRPDFAKPPQHRRSPTVPERDFQPWVHAVRETRSCPISPSPANNDANQ